MATMTPDEAAKVQRCSLCGERPQEVDPAAAWRWNGERWQHHHGYPTGYYDAMTEQEYFDQPLIWRNGGWKPNEKVG